MNTHKAEVAYKIVPAAIYIKTWPYSSGIASNILSVNILTLSAIPRP